jgi:hypothetical protein
VAVPELAVLLAFSVSVLLVALPRLNEAVTPFGKPLADRLTVPLKPFNSFMVIELVTLFPRATLKVAGEAESLKSGAGAEAFTVKLTEVVCVKLPEVPVTVTVTVPSAAVLLAASVKTLLPVVGFGLKPADTPLGNAEVTDKPTLPANPFNG